MRNVLNFRMIVGLLAVLGLCFYQPSISTGAEKVRFILNWLPVGYHAGFVAARDKGLFTKAGVDVDIISGKGSGLAVKTVGRAGADVGLADGGVVVSGRSRGAKVRMVGAYFDRSRNVIFVLKGSGISGPKDFVGRTLASASGSAARVLFPAFAHANGIAPDSVKWLTIKPGIEPITLVRKHADGIPSSLTALPNFKKAASDKGLQVEMIRYSDHGLDIFDLTIISSDAWIQSNPKLLRAFLKGSFEGIRWGVEHPSDAVDMLLKAYPALSRGPSEFRWKMATELVVSAAAKKHGFGYIDPKKVRLTRDTISKYKKVDRDVSTQELYTNDYLPGIFPPK